MQNLIRGWDLIPGILLSVVLLSACGQAQPQTAVDVQASQVTGPRIVLKPSSGALNSPVTIDGAGFPTDMHITIGFGSTTDTRDPVQIGEVVTNGVGQFKLIFIIPRTWIDGAPVRDVGLNITATSTDRSISVSALYTVISTPQQPRPESVTPQATSSIPQITILPIVGAPGSRITVHGTGFPAQTDIVVRIGVPGTGAMPEIYGNANSDGNGSVVLSFSLPINWQDGRVISDKRLVIVATTRDGDSRALTEFAFNPTKDAGTSAPTIALTTTSHLTQTSSTPLTTTRPLSKTEGSGAFSPEPINASVAFLNSLLRDPSGASSVSFLSQRLRTEISANWVLPTGLGIQPGYSSFQVALLSSGEESVVIQATLTYESGASIRNFTVIKEGANWRIDKVVSGSR